MQLAPVKTDKKTHLVYPKKNLVKKDSTIGSCIIRKQKQTKKREKLRGKKKTQKLSSP